VTFYFSARALCRIDIERYYGKPKAIAKRVPVLPPVNGRNDASGRSTTGKVITGVTETETEGETEETEGEEIFRHVRPVQAERVQTPASSSSRRSIPSNTSSTSLNGVANEKKKAVSQHDLLNKYFRRDTVVLKNLDPLRFVFSLLRTSRDSPLFAARMILCSFSSYSTRSLGYCSRGICQRGSCSPSVSLMPRLGL
jgi:hypothetical protein